MKSRRTKKCDRCGKLYEHYDGFKEFKNTEKANGVYLIDRDLDNKHRFRKIYDFCPDCMRKFEEFLLSDCGSKADEFKVELPDIANPGNVKLGDETFQAYLSECEVNVIKTPLGTVTKRKITLVEV